jgi:signal transduction histidine kinase
MRLVPRTLAGQLIALLLAALAISQIIAFLIYNDERSDALRQADRFGLIENTASVLRMLRLAPPELRDELARAASSSRVRFWTTGESVIPAVPPEAGVPVQIARIFGDALRDRVRVVVLPEGEPIRRPPPPDFQRFVPFQEDRYDILVSVPFTDSGWLNAQTQISTEPVTWAWASTASTAVMVIAILLIVAITARRATHPLSAVAAKADALGRGAPEPPLAETGPDEVRRVTVAFNRMQERLSRFVADRTRMLAAIGHDLRTPITSLKLRAELLDDEEARSKITATLEDMQQMIEATLAFAREEATAEPARTVDLSALISTIVDDYTDLGKDVRFPGGDRLAYRCRPTALRRAITNLLENAIRYGERARVSLINEDSGPVIAIEDRGPGIPPDRMNDVFQPFVRLEESRSRSTGGVGLGLSIARSIVLAHGGELVLANIPTGGLRAELRLPRVDQDIGGRPNLP